MRLPVLPPVKPMLATAQTAVPDQPPAPRWSYEPKWDGFRCIVFRDGDEVVLGSRGGRPLTRYFPEVVDAVLAELPRRCVVDGEVVVRRDGDGLGDRLDWEALSQRIHPAESRVRLLAGQTPAELVAFDLLALGDDDLTGSPFAVRRHRLVEALAGAGGSCHVTATTQDAARAREWFDAFEGAGLDGVVAKPLDTPYLQDERAMVKVKHVRTADCVVMGYREHKSVDGIGSMLLGLYRDGELHMVGGASAFTAARRAELLAELSAYRVGEAVTAEGEQNRWNWRKDNSWVPLRPELVVEVRYDQMEGERLRHAARFLRWRLDKDPAQCTYDQLEVPVRYDLAEVLAT